MKKSLILIYALSICLLGVSQALAGSVYAYKASSVKHPGKNITPPEAYELIQTAPQSTFLVDVRTRAEHQFVGHPVGAYLVPVNFLSTTFKDKKYELVENQDFGKNIMERFNPETDTLIFMCRSGTRSTMALNAAVKGGWPADKAYSIMGGFEGGKIKNANSSYNGARHGGGWRNEGLPWTYKMDAKCVY
jgi:rhodanese-related sulfurtransferase